MIIKGLNALRILAEFVVVFHHVYLATDDANTISPVGITLINDLMSLFFVLSGTVSMLSGVGDSVWGYYKRKLTRVGFLYYLSLFIRHVIHRTQTPTVQCDTYYLCWVLDFAFLSQYLNCFNLGDNTIGVGWYLCILASFWAIFPYAHPYLEKFYARSIWIKMCVLYVAYMLVSLFMPFNTKTFAPLRMFEFAMGCGVAKTLEDPQPLFLFYVCINTMSVLYIVYHFQLDWCINNLDRGFSCNPFHYYHTESCYTSLFVDVTGKFSLFWCVAIHTIASRDWLKYTIFDVLNPISVHVYLLHDLIAKAIIEVARHVLQIQCETAVLMPVIYYLCYEAYILQEQLGWYTQQIFSKFQPLEDTEENTVKV